ncbi:hypothetical protein ACOSQ2_002479 [Xanthoceras sorbifolium]
MAMGGSHKAMNNGSRGRRYGLMLLLAFGAAFFGVMVLHKLRERRIFSLLVNEKDHQLFSLQLLLQKEREHSKEMKRKIEEMKAKIYSLRTQKMELDRRLMEMQSTINSLKDEQKAIESALEEKQNEIKMQREATDLGKENSRLTALKESLIQKEAEIEDLKGRLKVWLVSTDDPSNLPVNLTTTSNMAEKDKIDINSSKEEHMATNSMADDNSTTVDDRNEKRAADTNSRELIVEHFQKLENTQDGGFKNESVVGGKGRDRDQAKENDFQEQDGFAMGGRKNIANSTEQIVDDAGGDVLKRRDDNSDVKDENGRTTLRKPENSQDKNRDVQAVSEGGMTLEMLDTRFQARSRLRRHGRLTRTKEKRLRSRTSRESKASNKGIEERKERQTSENQQKESKAVDSIVIKLPKVTLEDTKHLKNRDVNADPNQKVEQANEILKSNGEGTNILNYTNKQKLDEVRQPEKEASGTQPKMGSRDVNEQEHKAIQMKDDNQEDIEVADIKEPETEATDGDKEEYKEEIDES